MRSKISAILRAIGIVAMTVTLAGTTVLMPSPAYARGHGGYHHGGGWGWGWGLGIGAGLGLGAAAAWGWPGYYYPYAPAPYPYPYYVPAVPATTVIQQAPTMAPAPAAASWYYCKKPKGYYPYVSACPSGWQQVPATPPGAPQQ